MSFPEHLQSGRFFSFKGFIAHNDRNRYIYQYTMKVNKETLPSSLESFISLLISGIYVPSEHNYSSENQLQMLVRPCGLVGMSLAMGLDIQHSLPTSCTERINQTRSQDVRKRVLPVLRMLHFVYVIVKTSYN